MRGRNVGATPEAFTDRRIAPLSVGAREDEGALSPTVLGWSHTWHPQGPIHPSPSPVPLHFRGAPPHTGRWRGAERTETRAVRDVVARGGGAGLWGPCGCQASARVVVIILYDRLYTLPQLM